MGLWSRLTAGVNAFRKDAGPVGEELFSLVEGWGLSSAGVPVNSISAMQHVAVMACVSILSEDVAKLPIPMYRRLANGGKERVTDHYLARLLKKPNRWQSRFEFVEMQQAALVLRGNAYAVILRNERGYPTELIPIHPDRVTLYEAPGGEYFFLVSRQGLHETALLAGMPALIAAEDMLHVRWLSTWNSLLGSSRITLMRESIGVAMSQEQQTARLAGSGVRPGGVLMTDNKLDKEVIERIKADWQQQHGGWRNAGKTAVLEQGLKWEALGMSMVDAEFMASRQYELENIVRGFRVPRHKLGLPIDGAAATMVQYEQMYLNDVISSYCERWIPKLEELGGIDGDEYFVEFDYDHFLKADIQTRLTAKRTGVIGMIFTPNEVRAGEGLPRVKGGDTLYQPTNVAPIGFTPAAAGSGPGSDLTGEPAPGGDGDGTRLPGDEPAANQ